MNLASVKPEKDNQWFWVERTASLPKFLGPYSSYETAIQSAKEWKNEGGIVSAEHAEIFLIVSSKGRWKLPDVQLRTTLGMLFW